MIPNYKFSKHQLTVMGIKDLRDLASYYGAEHDKDTPKSTLIKRILAKQIESFRYDLVSEEREEPMMSVRLKRIRDMQEGEQ